MCCPVFYDFRWFLYGQIYVRKDKLLLVWLQCVVLQQLLYGCGNFPKNVRHQLNFL